MAGETNSSDSGYEGSVYDSSLESPHGTPEVQPAVVEEKPWWHLVSFRDRKTLFLVNGVVLFLIAVIGAISFFLLRGTTSLNPSNGQKTASYAVSSLSVKNIKTNEELQIGSADHLTINGQVNVGNTLVLVPTSAPTNPTAGQIYYSQTTNTPYYYNGTQFVSFSSGSSNSSAQNAITSAVTSLGGSSGAITLGPGLQVVGGQLQAVLQAGNGIAVNGTTVSNSGVISLSAGTSNITVSQDGSGHYTVSDSTTGLLSGGGTPGQLAMFNTDESLGNSILNESGNTITVAGALGVTGAISANTLQQTAPGNNLSISAGTDNLNITAANTSISGNLSASGVITADDLQSTSGFTLETPVTIADHSNGGAIGSAASTVDIANTFNVDQTTAGQTLSLPNPTNTAAGRIANINNYGTTTFTMYGSTIPVGGSISFLWSGTAWTSNSSDLGISATHNLSLTATNLLTFNVGGYSFTLPTYGTSKNQTICTTGISCATGGGQAVILQPGGVQNDTGTGTSVWINKTTGVGDIIDLQGGPAAGSGGLDEFVVAYNGNTTIGGTLNVNGANSLTLGSGTNDGSVIFTSSGGSNTVTLQAPTTNPSATYKLSLPTSAPQLGQCLENDNSTVGQLVFASCQPNALTLQTAYSASTGGTTPEIILDSTRNGIDIQDQSSGSIGATQSLFSVRGVGTASTLGASLFTVNASGQVAINNGSTSTTPTISYDLSFGQGANRTIGVEAQAASNTAGNNLTVSAGGGNGTGAGGFLNLLGGAGGSASGGSVVINGGSGSSLGSVQLQSGGGVVSIGAVGPTLGASTVNIATSSSSANIQGVTIGSNGDTSNTLTLDAGTGANAIQIGNSNAAHGIQIGTGAGLNTIVIGSTNTTSTTSIQGGTGPSAIGLTPGSGGGIVIGNSIAGAISLQSANTLSVTSTNFNLSGGALTIGTSGNQATLLLTTGTAGRSVTFETQAPSSAGNGTIQLPSIPGGNTDTVCLQILNNCNGGSTATGVTTVGGTAGYLSKFTGSATIANSELYDSGTGVDVGYTGTTPAALFNVGSSNQFQVSTTGAVTAVGVNAGAALLQGSLGLTITGATSSLSGGIINLNVNSNFATNINTGTSTGGIALGNSANAGAITLQSGNSISLDGAASTTYAIGASSVGGTITIGGTAGTGNITLGSSSAIQSVLIANGTGTATVKIANNTSDGATVTLGSTNTATSITLQGGASSEIINNTGAAFNGTPANGILTIGTNTTTATGGLYFGTDTDLYRLTNNSLKTGGSLTVANTLSVIGTPAANNNSSLVQLGATAIASNNSLGTYLGINQSSNADFLNFQVSGVSELQVSSAGVVTAATSLSVGTASSINGSVSFASQGGNSVSLQAPTSGLTGPITLTLPSTVGGANSCLKSNGSGVLSFANCTAGAGGTGSLAILNSDPQGGVAGLQTSAAFDIQSSSYITGNVIEEGPSAVGTAVDLLQLQNNGTTVESAFNSTGSSLRIDGATSYNSALTIGSCTSTCTSSDGINFGGNTTLYSPGSNTLYLQGGATQTLGISAASGSSVNGSTFNIQGGAGTGITPGGDLSFEVAAPPTPGINENLVSTSGKPLNMTADIGVSPQFIYWLNHGTTGIGRASTSGTGVNQSYIPGKKNGCSTSSSNPSNTNGNCFNGASPSITVDSNYIYWSSAFGCIGQAQLNTTPGSTQSAISPNPYFLCNNGNNGSANGSSGNLLFGISALTYSGGWLYWTTGSTASLNPNCIGRAQVTAGVLNNTSVNPTWICTGVNGAVINNPTSVGVNGNFLYWANGNTSNYPINYVSTSYSGGAVTEGIFSVSAMAQGLAFDSTNNYMFWTETSTNSIGRVALNPTTGAPVGGTSLDYPSPLFSTVPGGGGPVGVAVAGGAIFWVNSLTNAIATTSLGGSLPNAQSVVADFTGNTGSAWFHNTDNNTQAFQIQDSSSASLFNIDSTFTSNLLSNGDFENYDGVSHWSPMGNTALTLNIDTANAWQGNQSLQVTTISNGDGASSNYTFKSGQWYTLSMYVLAPAGAISDFSFGHEETTSLISCGTYSVSATTWTRVTCDFQATTNNAGFVYAAAGTAGETFDIDGVQLQLGSSSTSVPTPFNAGGGIQLNGVVDSPFAFQNKTDSTTAFQIQNAAGTSNLFVADTLDTKIGIGTAPTSTGATLQVTGNISSTTQITAQTGIFDNTKIVVTTASATAGRFSKNATVGADGVSGATGVTSGEVVVLDTTGSVDDVIDSNTSRDPRVYGVAEASGAPGTAVEVAIGGNTSVNAIVTGTGAINVGDQLVVSSTTGDVTKDDTATTGILGIATTSLASGSGSVGVAINVVNGQSTPRVQVDSTTAFQVQNAAGTNVFSVDTTSSDLRVNFGSVGDAWLGRVGSYILGSNASLQAQSGSATEVNVGYISGGYAGVAFGLSSDTSLYRLSAGVLQTGGVLKVQGAVQTYNAAAATLYVGKDSGTGRSINAAGTINASGADYAEWIPWSGTKPITGSIVSYGGSNYVVSSPMTAGFIGNDNFNGSNSILVTFTGQVPVLVTGPVEQGDILISNGDGTAKAVSPATATINELLSQIAIAQETNDSSVVKSVSASVGTSSDSMASALQNQSSAFSDISVSGSADLTDLNVSGSSNLASLQVQTENISGNLTVLGLTTVQNIQVNGHIITSGNTPLAILQSAAGAGADVSIRGTDTTGTLTITTGSNPAAGALMEVEFSNAYSAAPHVVLSPSNDSAAALRYFKGTTTPTNFLFNTIDPPSANTTYQYDYFIAQ